MKKKYKKLKAKLNELVQIVNEHAEDINVIGLATEKLCDMHPTNNDVPRLNIMIDCCIPNDGQEILELTDEQIARITHSLNLAKRTIANIEAKVEKTLKQRADVKEKELEHA